MAKIDVKYTHVERTKCKQNCATARCTSCNPANNLAQVICKYCCDSSYFRFNNSDLQEQLENLFELQLKLEKR